MAAGSIDAYGLLVEEFKSDDVIEQLAAAKRVPIVAMHCCNVYGPGYAS